MDLFIKKDWVMHSGEKSNFKIECDALTDEDLETIAHLIYSKFKFFRVMGIPRGGTRLAEKLKNYVIEGEDKILIVDDVLTTGASMEQAKHAHHRNLIDADRITGVVVFARGKCPDWVHPIFDMSGWLGDVV